jgi:hypothetical protein
MTRYLFIRRLYGPAFLLLVGVNALLNQADILSWGHSWPLYLILIGVLKLAERMALASEGAPSYPPYPGQPGAPVPPTYPAPAPTAPSTGLTPVTYELVKKDDGGQQ